MPVKAWTAEQKPESTPIKYPCIMKRKSDGILVLLTAPTAGTLLKGASVTVGFHTERWVGDFEPFNDVVHLQND